MGLPLIIELGQLFAARADHGFAVPASREVQG
jgi:hypothetical protein